MDAIVIIFWICSKKFSRFCPSFRTRFYPRKHTHHNITCPLTPQNSLWSKIITLRSPRLFLNLLISVSRSPAHLHLPKTSVKRKKSRLYGICNHPIRARVCNCVYISRLYATVEQVRYNNNREIQMKTRKATGWYRNRVPEIEPTTLNKSSCILRPGPKLV